MIVVALLLSVLIGVSLGMLGGGGSTLTMPILLYVLGMEEKEAIATSLLVVGLTSITAVASHAERGNVEWRTGIAFALAGATGAFLGGLASAYVAGVWLIRGFLLMMVGTGVAMLRARREVAVAATFSLPKVITTGFALGIVTGMVGAGGGFVIVPALVFVGGLPMKRAVGTSLVVITAQAFAGFVGHASHSTINYEVTSGVTAAAVVGSLIGGMLAAKVPADALRKAFGVLVLLMAAWMAWKQF